MKQLCLVTRRLKAMIPVEEREKAFRKELKELLEKHGAEIEIANSSYPATPGGGLIAVRMASTKDNNGNTEAEYTAFQL